MSRTPPDTPLVYSKACTACRRIIPVPGYAENAKARDGYRTNCRACNFKNCVTRLKRHNATLLKQLLKSSRTGSVRSTPIIHVCTGKIYSFEITRLEGEAYRIELWDKVFAKEILEFRDIERKDLFKFLVGHFYTQALRIIPTGIPDIPLYGILKENRPPKRDIIEVIDDWEY